ncbi:LolA-like outer membrane lipoprotein chaperone [Helicobacter cappadocius]|uniref:LolA-like outer membrane lipoprotein chaperone n=1 Tax=Helicobacter cappadocius TaxID=3063998 RepID=A0AA90PZU7_9HELI|nr:MULTISPECIES: LolA-like outer membrane lipoprotein chaperone [unclassified Helicobacter]MDO7253595.1 LolA-like outer membrane lipoprotein chaperone [Helicobacter sp. faydin-H75]MDP2539523.1 LolA-like outer membrane lipoprotein chaperone [Helicobacter sp. faydin-H76]
MYFIRIFFVFCVLCVSMYGLSEDIKTFRADFIQNVHSDNAAEVSYSGYIEAKSPNLAKWTYNKPLKKEIYIDGQDVVVYEPNLLQATITHLKENTDFISILKKAVLSKDGKYRSKIGNTSYELTFKDQKPYLLDFVDEFGNAINIKFSNVVINSVIDKKDFVFIPGPDIDIIHQ